MLDSDFTTCNVLRNWSTYHIGSNDDVAPDEEIREYAHCLQMSVIVHHCEYICGGVRNLTRFPKPIIEYQQDNRTGISSLVQ